MKTIYKYEIPSKAVTIALPQGATILSVAVQNECPYLWAMVDPNQPTVEKHIRVIATGQPLEDEAAAWSFVGTFFLNSGSLVFHVFEVNPLATNPVVAHETTKLSNNV